MNPERSFWRREAPVVLLWLLGLLAALLLLGAVIRSLGQQHLRGDAETTALRHAEVVSATVPGLPSVFAGRGLQGETLQQLRRLRQVGEVFRFKLFDREGRQVLVSDDLDGAQPLPAAAGPSIAEHQGARNQNVQAIVLGGRNFIELKSGAGKPDRPAWYSEAYVPVLRDGQVIGVVEVYVDQTRAEAGIHAEYGRVALTVAALMLLLAAVAGWRGIRHLRKQRHVEERVHYLAQHDILSGALNRASFGEALQQAVARHARAGGAFAVLCIDLDGFKEVNDAFGHAAGDDVLRCVTERLRGVLRHGDAIARLGGDEFAVLQDGVAGAADVSRLAQRIVEVLAEPHQIQGRGVLCAASVGAAVFGTDANNVPDLLHKADLALYRAKSEGRGGFSFYDAALDRQLQSQRDLVRDLREAVANETLELHYQAQYGADGVSLVGYEALLRWKHPIRGNVPPGEFIGVAESSGLIEPLGAWVLKRACREAAGWPEGLAVSVNLSAMQFRSDGLMNTVAAALDASGLPPQRLELEITESLLMSNTDRVLRTLHALSAMGVRIAMDDFGTGYSSLAYLWRFPFDKVKIDRSFTQGLGSDPKVALIVRSIVTLAHSMRIRVNAEGVETSAQMGALQRYGCDELQGFLLGRPAPADTLQHRGAVRVPPERPAPRPSALQELVTMQAPL
ncbi:MAG TPA: bifunctional diguanylate cyclase/phosphodiesterase [Rubrivivax sp.]|nr:bifunctional diguanylate cyclase/phosphodiesterase [Rubrivivax sp.]